MSPPVDVKEFLAGFLAESEEHFRAVGKNLMALDESLARGGWNARAVRELFRSIHTLKGLSAMVGAEAVVEIAHAMETVLRGADQKPGSLRRPALDPLMRGFRAMEERVAAMGQGRPIPLAPPALIESLEALDAGPGSGVSLAQGELTLPADLAPKLGAAERQSLLEGTSQSKRALRLDFVPSAELAAQGINITSVRERVGKVAEIVKVVPTTRPEGGLAFALVIVTAESDEALRAAAGGHAQAIVSLAAPKPPPPTPLESEPEAPLEVLPAADPHQAAVRVPVARLDDALERLSALVVTRFRLGRAVTELSAKGVDVRGLAEIVAENGRQLRDLRGAIMRARMVPLREVLERVPLIVRGLSRSTGKPVQIVVSAGDAEVDKAVGDRLFPAVIHLVRNAVDHGLEGAEARKAAGKPAEGRIEVRAAQRSDSQLELSISDDGGGIDAVRVAQAAGRPVPASAAALLELIARPGLSTRAEATTTSGRGLGMDIVKQTVVDQLGGELSLQTTPGQGTTFLLRIPLTITIIDAFSFVCGEQPYVVPVSMIEEIVEVDPSQTVRSPTGSAGRELRMLQRRGGAVPLLRLQDVLSQVSVGGTPRKALVVRRNGQPFAFGIDRVLGQQEVVVRPMEDALVRAPGVTGATDLGDGRPTLVLDLMALTPFLAEVQA